MNGLRQITTSFANIRRYRPLVVLLFFAALLAYVVTGCEGSREETAQDNTDSSANVNDEPALPSNLSDAIAEKEASEDGTFGKFAHNSEYHARLPCLTCHKRDSNATRIGFPGKVEHTPCAGCHTLQFANKNSAICTICHSDPQEGSMRSFPPLRSFGARFVHAKHSGTSCATCHKNAGKAMSIPRGGTAHATCFQCHSSNASNTMASCGLCHQPGAGRMQAAGGAKAFKANFSHAKHAEKNLNCKSCHAVYSRTSGRNQVSEPATVMHFPKQGTLSCGTCHNNERAFGGEDFADCKRCHQGNSFTF